jgi:hypothetical protein
VELWYDILFLLPSGAAKDIYSAVKYRLVANGLPLPSMHHTLPRILKQALGSIPRRVMWGSRSRVVFSVATKEFFWCFQRAPKAVIFTYKVEQDDLWMAHAIDCFP